MTLCVVVKGSEGMVLAAESRASNLHIVSGFPLLLVEPVNDTAIKLFDFDEPNRDIAVLVYGSGAIGEKPVASFMPDFGSTLRGEAFSIQDFAKRLSKFFKQRWEENMPVDYQGPDVSFLVGGKGKNRLGSQVLSFNIPRKPEVEEKEANIKCGNIEIFLGGDFRFVERLICGFDRRLLKVIEDDCGLQPKQYESLLQAVKRFEVPLILGSLENYEELAVFLIRMTINIQATLPATDSSCGGPIKVAIIPKWGGPKFVQHE